MAAPEGVAVPMIHLLAELFRMIHRVIGITAPEPGYNERSFVFMWLALIVFFLLFCGFCST
jgi:hypothetical protein